MGQEGVDFRLCHLPRMAQVVKVGESLLSVPAATPTATGGAAGRRGLGRHKRGDDRDTGHRRHRGVDRRRIRRTGPVAEKATSLG